MSDHAPCHRAALAAALALLAVGGASAATAAPAIPLNNGQETTDAKGGAHGMFSYTIDGDQFCYTIEVTGLTVPAGAAHVHSAPRGEAGPIRIHLDVPNETSFAVDGCTTVTDPSILAGIQEDPGDWYVNVHTQTYPGGEVRGQLK
ncbi:MULTISPECIES: CHRD domain-containing protein [Microbacterium]|uniref:CHRD domain-containing protein n=1 Tax=Microbacterium TaxID=33882 RepID=UPI00217F1449|nr:MULTISPECIES: CHRD domain-containing protein [Microbacterium]UWF78091.1 CHRD domain-containing protein [Microbacterium neungamense]WCM56269.1 CHRD domain-containing protein [Microbacterium sp. EF45047]